MRLLIFALFLLACSGEDNSIVQEQENGSIISFEDDIYSVEILFMDYEPSSKELVVVFRGNIGLNLGIYLSVDGLLLREIVDYSGSGNGIKFITILESAPEEIIVYWYHVYVG